MESTKIRQSAHALLQEIVHWHMVNGSAGTLGDIEKRLEGYYPIDNEENITFVGLGTGKDLTAFMAGGYDPDHAVVSYVTIQNKVTITAISDRKVEIKIELDDGEITPVYDYVRLIDDVHKALGTGRKIDLASYDVAKVLRDIDREA